MRIILACILLLAAGPTHAADHYPGRHADFYLDRADHFAVADSVIAATRSRLIDLLGDSLDYRPQIHVVASQQRFDSLIAGAFPDWGAAAAIPTRQLVVIKSPDDFNINKTLVELLAHEYSHLAVAHRTGWYRAPRWFDEGLAMYVGSEWSWEKNLAMSRAAVFGDLIPLREIDGVNRFGSPLAELAYAQSYQTVNYLFDLYREEAVTIFLDEIKAGQSIDAALMAATGSDYAGFEEEVRIYLTGRYNFATLLMDTMYFWLALAVVVVIAAMLYFKRRREYYRKWEEEEKFQSTDFDYGDPDNPEVPDDDEPWRQ